MDWYIKQQQLQHEQLRQRQIELQQQQHASKQRIKQKHQELDSYEDDQNDDLEPDDSISNHAPDNDNAETDDAKLKRLSTAERREEKSDENSSSIEIPIAYDSSSGTEQPEADILTIDHTQTSAVEEHKNKSPNPSGIPVETVQSTN